MISNMCKRPTCDIKTVFIYEPLQNIVLIFLSLTLYRELKETTKDSISVWPGISMEKLVPKAN